MVLCDLRTCLVSALLLCGGLNAGAQVKWAWRGVQRVDSMLTARYRRGNIDTLYIKRPQAKWTLTGRLNVSGSVIENEGNLNGVSFHSKMTSDYKSTLSVGVNYLGVTLNVALNPAKLLGKYNDFELNLNSYGNRWGFDFIYQNARNFTGWQESGGTRIDLPHDLLSVRSVNVNFYYAFNHRRFSYPAAFTQSYVQRRSAGSFLLAVSGQGQHTETKDVQESVLRVTNIGIGGGYGYNWVPGRRWLLHLSALPTLIVYSNASLTDDNERMPIDYHFPEVIITARGAIVRQFGNKFVGLTMVYNFTNIGDRDDLSVYNMKWRTRLLFGYRF